MYKYKQVKDNAFVLSIDNHEGVAAALMAFCKEKNILAGNITGLGAISEATFRFLNPATKKYVDKTFKEQMEITNLTGNISQKDGKPYPWQNVVRNYYFYKTKHAVIWGVTAELLYHFLEAAAPCLV